MIDKVFIHCSATPPNMDIGVEEIRSWHKARGWKDVGYHIIIRRDGSLEFGRPFGDAGAHVRGWNKSSLGVCLIGGLSRSGDPTPNYADEQMLALRRVLAALQILFVGSAIHGHNEFDEGKECPCFDVTHWLETGELK